VLLGELVDIKYYGELSDPSEFSKELLEEFLSTGYAVEQKIDGVIYIRMTELYYEDLGEYIIKHPRELCRDYWTRLIEDKKYYDLVSFIKKLCETHSTIKKLTRSTVDFCEVIGEELS
jgi:hypothetical protein